MPADRIPADRIPTPRAWDTAWEGTPSWETGRPQPAIARLVDEAAFAGATTILDVGCGSGRHAVLLATAGHDVTGIDIAAAALERACTIAREAGVGARTTFVVGDALRLGESPLSGAPFDAALDVGLFHVLQPDDRARYAAGLAAVLRPGGRAFVVAWSDRNPFGFGPARVTRRELRSAFSSGTGWRVGSIEATALETNLPVGRVHAWLARLARR